MGWNDDYDDDDYGDIRMGGRDRDRAEPPTSQSGIGIISLITSVVAGVMLAVLIVAAVVISAGPNPPPDNDPKMVMIVLGLIASLAAALIGLILGIIGCIQPHRGILCAVLGSIFNALILLGVIGLICAGVMFG